MRKLSLEESIGDHLRWAFPDPEDEDAIQSCVNALKERKIASLDRLRRFDFSKFPELEIFAGHLTWIIPLIPLWNKFFEMGLGLQEWWKPLKDDPSYLWDVREAYSLLWLGATPPEQQNWTRAGKQHVYQFVGRGASKAVYERILEMEGQTYLRLVGAKGSGKTLVVASVCSHIQQAGLKQIAYLDAETYVRDPFTTLRDALLLAFFGQEQAWRGILKQQDLTALEDWCDFSGGENLVFVVDDWASLDVTNADPDAAKKSAAKDSIRRARQGHPMVLNPSVNSQEHIRKMTNDKEALVDMRNRLELDGPFSEEELRTWMALANLPDGREQEMDFLTGGMPRLLDYFKQAHWDVNAYLQALDREYTSKLVQGFITKLDTVQRLAAACDLIVRGNHDSSQLEWVPQICFYSTGQGELKLLCPYLEVAARKWLVQRCREMEAAEKRLEIDGWVNVVRMDLRRQLDSRCSPRLGWNVEGLVIDVMRHQGQVFAREEDTTFAHAVNYPPGGEKETCLKLPLEDLTEGVLLVPQAFNERAIDVLFVKVKGSTLMFYAIQISIAKWKLKSKKSHLVWREEVLPSWKEEIKKQNKKDYENYDDRYYYILPKNLTEADLPADEQDGGAEVTVQFKKLADVRGTLATIDEKLTLAEPVNLQPRDMDFCMAKNSDNVTPCGNWVERGSRCRSHIHALTLEPDTGYHSYFKKRRYE